MKAAALTLVATAALAGCGTAQDTTSAKSPPSLHLTDDGTADRALGLPQPAGTATSTSPYVLHATLPTTTPSPAPVWTLPSPKTDDARHIASALQLPPTVTAVHGGWVARSQSRLLTVRSDGSWSWGMDCMPDSPIEEENLQVACGSASTSNAQPPGPSAGRARALSSPILQRLGWGAAAVDVTVGRPTTTVTARQVVGSTPTADWTTTLTWTATGQLDSAYGWAGTPSRGHSYPLIDAARAFAQLKARPWAVPDICRVRTDGKPGCAPPEPIVIVGARLGLALRHDATVKNQVRPLLVPAWLFDVQGSAQPLAVVAVAPQYLAPPPSGVPQPGTPKQVVPASPNSAAPASPPDAPADATSPAPSATR